MAEKMVNWKPEGYHSLTPYLCVDNIEQAIDFYRQAFGAEEISRMSHPAGSGVMHAELKIGDSIFMLGGAGCESGCKSPRSLGGTTGMVHIYVKDVDDVFERAKSAGAQVEMALENTFWGDRFGTLTDPFGQKWSLATHVEDVTEEEMRERAEAFFAKMSKH